MTPKLDKQALFNAWKEHLRPKLSMGLFPRDWGLKRYPAVESMEEYLARTYQTYLSVNSYVGIYSHAQHKLRIIDTIFVDIDSSNHGFNKKELEDNYSRLLELKKKFRNMRLYFSGNAGFHCFFDFDCDQIDAFDKETVIRLFRNYGLNVDSAVILDIKRISRIPFSLNLKTRRFCIPIDDGEDIDVVLDQSISPIAKTIRVIPDNMAKLELIKEGFKEEFNYSAPQASNENGYSWIISLLEHPIKDGRHRALWLIIAPYLVNVLKVSSQEATDIIRDYLDKCNKLFETDATSKSEYYVNYALRTGLKPPSLQTLRLAHQDLYEILIKEKIIEGRIGSG